MGIQINDSPTAQTVQGQPTTATETPASTTEVPLTLTPPALTATDEAAEASTTETPATVDDTTKPKVDESAATAQVNISPDALRQITALTKSNRQFKTKIAELEKQIQQPADVQTKLARLAELEAALGSPRKWLALTGKTLEDVAADTIDVANESSDPRIAQLSETVAAQQKELEALKGNANKSVETEKQARVAAVTAKAVEYAQGMISNVKIPDGSLRWDRISKDTTAAKSAVDASIIVIKRDYGELKDDKGNVIRADKQIDHAIAQRVLEQCLDEAEAMALAKELIDQRKKGTGQSLKPSAQSRGIEIRAEGAADAPSATPPPKPTIDGNRAPLRTATVQRGQTDVRTARQRAMRIAGADNE